MQIFKVFLILFWGSPSHDWIHHSNGAPECGKRTQESNRIDQPLEQEECRVGEECLYLPHLLHRTAGESLRKNRWDALCHFPGNSYWGYWMRIILPEALLHRSNNVTHLLRGLRCVLPLGEYKQSPPCRGSYDLTTLTLSSAVTVLPILTGTQPAKLDPHQHLWTFPPSDWNAAPSDTLTS